MKPTFIVTHRYGAMDTWDDPSRIVHLVNELDERAEDLEHTSVAVHDASGLCISAAIDGTVIMENIEDPDEPSRYLRGVSRERQIDLLKTLAEGRTDDLASHPWASH
jgi:hypothetical protein